MYVTISVDSEVTLLESKLTDVGLTWDKMRLFEKHIKEFAMDANYDLYLFFSIIFTNVVKRTRKCVDVCSREFLLCI